MTGIITHGEKRLVAFARVIALHRWSEAVGYFDPEHNILLQLVGDVSPIDGVTQA